MLRRRPGIFWGLFEDYQMNAENSGNIGNEKDLSIFENYSEALEAIFFLFEPLRYNCRKLTSKNF